MDIIAGDDFVGPCDKKCSDKCVWFWMVMELWLLKT